MKVFLVSHFIKLLETVKSQVGDAPIYIAPGLGEHSMDNDVRVSAAIEEGGVRIIIMPGSVQDAIKMPPGGDVKE